MEASNKDELFSSLVSNIKSYSGNDPLRPWLQGIRKMKESLPPHILKEKLPRFLQKCAQTFESDRRYRNDSRYIRIWIQLMDYVDDARVVLRKMEKNHIGLKRAMFYSAYALYYEKQKKFEDAEYMYHLGVQNLAEPADELQKSYEQFLHRMKLLKERKTKKIILNGGKSSGTPPQQANTKMIDNGRLEKDEDSRVSLSVVKCGDHQHQCAERVNSIQGCSKCAARSFDMKLNATAILDEASCKFVPSLSKDGPGSKSTNEFYEGKGNRGTHMDKQTQHCGDDTVVVKFVGSAVVGKSEAEDACHHGLVDPTVNMKEAMNAIGSMFREPLEPEPMARRRSHQSKPKENPQSNVLEVFVDDGLEEEVQPNQPELMNPNPPNKQTETKSQKPFVDAFKIWTEDDDDDDNDNDDDNENDDDCSDGNGMEIKEHIMEGPKSVTTGLNSRSDAETNANSSEDVQLNGDTVIRRFVGSTVFDDPWVENACHHGLVDPTINLKEAMDDINSMFGKPLNFVRANKPKKQVKPIEQKPASQGFSILADDDLGEDSRGQASKSMSSKFGGEGDLFEQTIFTREAMADINEMFGKPLDF